MSESTVNSKMATPSLLVRAAQAYEQIILLAIVLFPILPISYLTLFQSSAPPFEAHRFHELAIAFSIFQGALIAIITWRCYVASGERFLYWLTLGFASFTFIYAPHGIFTGISHENIGLFLIFGPISRLSFAVFLIIGLAQYKWPTDVVSSRSMPSRWVPWLVSFAFIDIIVFVVLSTAPPDTSTLRRGMEITALSLEVISTITLITRHGHSPLLRLYGVATAYFALSSISFLISKPWAHQWWLAHLIFASGFLLLSFGVLRAYLTTRSIASVYSQEQWVKKLSDEKERAETALRELEKAHKKLAESAQVHAHLAAIVQSAEEAILSLSPEGSILSWNAAAERMLGYTAEEIIGRPVFNLVPEDFMVQETRIIDSVHHGQTVKKVESRRRRKDGRLIDIWIAKAPLKDPSGTLVGIASVWTDISEAKRLEGQLAASNVRLSQVLNRVVTGIIVHGDDKKIIFANAEASRLLGLSNEQFFGRAPIDPNWCFVDEDGRRLPAEKYPISIVMSSSAPLHNYVIGVKITEEALPRWVMANAMPRLDISGKIEEVIISFVDISERKAMAEELKRIANIDSLTRLATRRFFIEQSNREFERCVRRPSPIALLLVDIDHFKSVNDRYGHPAGDVVLSRFGDLVKMSIRDIDIAGRLGGEEFAILLVDSDLEYAQEIAERIRKVVEDTIVPLEGGTRLSFTVSIGVAQATSEIQSIDALMAAADRALYRAKGFGRNRIEPSTNTSR